MSKRAEQRALGAYPRPELHGNSNIHYDLDDNRREGFIEGYEQAEKDLALTWIDIRNILSIADEVEQENDCNVKVKSELCEEVLRRFNNSKAKDNGQD